MIDSATGDGAIIANSRCFTAPCSNVNAVYLGLIQHHVSATLCFYAQASIA